MYTKKIVMFGDPCYLHCDGLCKKAWGINSRPMVKLDPDDPDDYYFLADNELGDAPKDPGTYEGGHAKPNDPTQQNKWCSRECERSTITHPGEPLTLPDFSVRFYNQPWKYENKETH